MLKRTIDPTKKTIEMLLSLMLVFAIGLMIIVAAAGARPGGESRQVAQNASEGRILSTDGGSAIEDRMKRSGGGAASLRWAGYAVPTTGVDSTAGRKNEQPGIPSAALAINQTPAAHTLPRTGDYKAHPLAILMIGLPLMGVGIRIWAETQQGKRND